MIRYILIFVFLVVTIWISLEVYNMPDTYKVHHVVQTQGNIPVIVEYNTTHEKQWWFYLAGAPSALVAVWIILRGFIK